MKNYFYASITSLFVAALVGSGCAGLFSSHDKSSDELSAIGPTVIEARSNPKTIELDGNLQPIGGADVLAEIKDFNSNVSNATLEFVDVSLQVPMQHVAGTTWRGTLTQEQLKKLAVTGQTMHYEANISAVNERGQTAVTPKPVPIIVTAPDLAKLATPPNSG